MKLLSLLDVTAYCDVTALVFKPVH